MRIFNVVAIFIAIFILFPACDGLSPADLGSDDNPEIRDSRTLKKITLPTTDSQIILRKLTQETLPTQKQLSTAIPWTPPEPPVALNPDEAYDPDSIYTPDPNYKDCYEIGVMDGVNYNRLDTEGDFTACFKNVNTWQGNQLYGEYRRLDVTSDCWHFFITDEAGAVHYLPLKIEDTSEPGYYFCESTKPKKDGGFANEKLIRPYDGKPAYLRENNQLVYYDLAANEEVVIVECPVSRFLVMPQSDGDHMVYTGLYGGKRIKPDGSVDDIPEISARQFFYRIPGGDMGYMRAHDQSIRNMWWDGDGNIDLPDITLTTSQGEVWTWDSRVVPPIMQTITEHIEAPLGVWPEIKIYNSMPYLNRLGDFIVGAEIQLTDRTTDIKTVKWCNDLGICGGPHHIALINYFLYAASTAPIDNDPSNTSNKLYQVNKDLSEVVMLIDRFQVSQMSAMDNELLLITGYNLTTGQNETFYFNPQTRVKTIIGTPLCCDWIILN